MGRYVDKIQYWLALANGELNSFTDAYKIGALFNALDDAGYLEVFELEDEKGVIAYTISDDMLGGDSLCELFMYIRPEFRGDIRLFKKLITHLEEKAKELECSSVKIASNIKYKDEAVLRILQRWGYKVDTVSKEVA